MGTTRATPRTRLRDSRALVALTVIGPLCEAVPLRYFRITAGLAPQLTAPTPFATFHDLRWLLVFHRTWPGYVVELALLIAARSLFHAAVVRAAWPPELARPTFLRAWQVSLPYVVSLVVVLSPSAVLVFAGGATSLSWLPIAGISLFLLVALLFSHGGVDARWWTRFPGARVCGWTLSTFFELNLVAAAILLGPWWVAWIFAGLGGLYNAWAWRGIVAAVVCAPAPRRRLPVIPIATVLMFALVIGLASFELRPYRETAAVRPTRGPTAADRRRIGVLLVDGFDSHSGPLIDPPLDSRFALYQFSYAGEDARGHWLPYTPRDTHGAIGGAVVKLDRQTRDLAAATGQPVRIIATSEGSLVARSYVQTYPNAPVSALVMVSPLIEPGRVYYPRRGDHGWGVAARAQLELLADVVQHVADIDLDPDMPFMRSIVDHAPTLRPGMLCPAPQVPVVAIEPLAGDASIPPVGYPKRIPVKVVVGFHGAGLRAALALVAADRLPSQPSGAGLVNRVIRSGATAWMVPELPVALNPAWSASQLDEHGCPLDGWPQP